MKLRTGLLLGAAFTAGIAVGPTSGLLAKRFGIHLLPLAWAADSSHGEIYGLLDLYSNVLERVRAEYVEPVNDRDLVENSINGMLTGLDPHSNYMNAKSYRDMQVQTRGEFGGLGIEVTQDNGFIKVITPIDDTPASKAGIKSGDLILSIDGQSVQGLTLNDAVDKMRGAPNSKIKLTIKREGVEQPLEVPLTREVIKIQVVKSHLEDGDIAYIRLTQFTEQSDSGLRKAFQTLKTESGGKLRGVVLDLRNNPGGLLDQAIAVSDDFIDEGEIVSTRARHPEDSSRWNAKGGDITGGLPVVMLINGGSASASEIVAGALQDHRRAVLVGTRSFGKGSVQTVIPVGDGAMKLTTARYYTPSGRSIQGLGILPDVEVQASRTEPTHFGPEHEADLNKALRNTGGVPQTDAPPPRTDLPAMAHDVPKLPPENFPTYDPLKSDTDFQLQQGLAVVRAMATTKHASR